MKRSTLNLMSAAMLVSLFALTACAEQDHMAKDTMDHMDKASMHTEMKDEGKMMVSEMEKPMAEDMTGKAETMKDEMESSMGSDMKKME
ncbi:hypothetical protein [Desulforhopalus sp. 52FAK]